MAPGEELYPGEKYADMVDDLNAIVARLDNSNKQLADVQRQVAITGKVIELYWQLESKSITLEDYRSRLMAILQEW